MTLESSVACFAGSSALRVAFSPRLGCASPGATFYRPLRGLVVWLGRKLLAILLFIPVAQAAAAQR